MVIYRTLANPAYLDLRIDPDDRPMGSPVRLPDPMEANYQRSGLARTMTARGWLSTWSLSSKARMTETMPSVRVPTLLIHPTADTEIRRREAQAIHDSSGAADKTLIEIMERPTTSRAIGQRRSTSSSSGWESGFHERHTADGPERLDALLAGPGLIVAPGVFDGFWLALSSCPATRPPMSPGPAVRCPTSGCPISG
jgi:hypothetical protein